MASGTITQDSSLKTQHSALILQARGVTKTFGHFPVLRGVNFGLGQGERVTLLGPNGAGKTTLLRILAMLSRPSGGEIEIAGIPLKESKPSIRALVGVLSHQTYLYEDLTARENLQFYGRVYGLNGTSLATRIEEILAKVGLEKRGDQRVRFFSRGMQQRLALARAVLHRPPILLLDEPDTGLDRQAAEMLAQVIAEPASGGIERSVLMTTHNLERGHALSHRLVVLAGGRIVGETPSTALDPSQVQSWYYDASRTSSVKN
jgi:heme exporter protein A